MKNIVYIGCVESSYVILRHMLEKDIVISGVITMDTSNNNADFQSLVPLAKKYNIDCFITNDINDKETVSFIKSKSPDVIYCFGWSRLIKKEVLSIPNCGVIGFHPAELPYNRGRHPLIWALALGLDKTASTFFIMNEGADTGDIISQKEICISYEDDARSLYDKVLSVAQEQVIEFTNSLYDGSFHGVSQDLSSGNTWRKRGRMDGQIDWRMSCDAIYNLVRALTHPYVGAHFMYEGKEVKVWKCQIESRDSYKNIEPGKVIKVNSETDFEIKAYDGIVHVLNCDKVIIREGEYLK